MARPAGKGGGVGGKQAGGKLTGAGGNVEDNMVEELLAFDGELLFKHINRIPTSSRRSAASTAASSSSLPPPLITSQCLQPYAFDKAEEQELESTIHAELNHIDFMFDIPEYTADIEDLKFINSINNKRQVNERLTQSDFEFAFNRLEKISIFQFWKTGSTIMIAGRTFIVDDRCDVCGGDNDRRNNKLLKCQICHMSVHQECYGLPYFPISSWKCRRCAVNPTMSIKCAFCPFEGGAMKFTSDNRAVHQLCAIWINGITVSQNAFLEPIDINTADTVLNTHKCGLCKQTYGAVIDCATMECNRKVHVTCAALAKLIMETDFQLKENKGLKKTPKEDDLERVYNRKIHCLQHSSFSRDDLLAAVKKVTELLEGRDGNLPIDLRASPINPKYIKPEFINSKLSKEVINLIYRFWFVKRLRKFCCPQINRVKVIYDRMARPIRHLQNEIPAPLYKAFKNRIYLNIKPGGSLCLTANFLENYPIVSDELLKYLTNSLGDDPEVPSVDYDNQMIIFQRQALHLHSIPLIDKDIEILFCRNKEDMCSVTVDLVRKYADPTLEFDLNADYSFNEAINAWDIIGLFFHLVVPEFIQIITFVTSLWYLDIYGVFRTFNHENPNAINLKKMGVKALHRQYPTMQDAYTDFLKMMHAANSEEIKDGRRQYINSFEEAACYLVPSKDECHILKVMLDEIEAEEEHKYKILLNYLMQNLTMNTNIDDEVDVAMPKCDHQKLRLAAGYAKNFIILEKTFPIPNMFLLTELFGRRQVVNKYLKIISLPAIGFTPMNGFRQDFILNTLFTNPFEFKTVSWVECKKLLDEREVKLGYKLKKEENGQAQVVKMNGPITRKRKALKLEAPSPSAMKKTRRGEEKRKVIPEIDDQIRVTRSGRRPIIKHDPIPRKNSSTTTKTTKNGRNNKLKPKKNPVSFNRRLIPDKIVHDTVVIVKKTSQGKNIAGKILDPLEYKETNPPFYQQLMSLPRKGKNVCVKLFLNENIIEWTVKTKISKMQAVKVKKYLERNKDILDQNKPSVKSITSAFKYYTDKFCT